MVCGRYVGDYVLMDNLRRWLGNQFWWRRLVGVCACCGKVPADKKSRYCVSCDKSHDRFIALLQLCFKCEDRIECIKTGEMQCDPLECDIGFLHKGGNP